ncbi:Fic family protein [Candidatus Parcubacteria bacterium]|nr:Fic family protein [Candidatus Parcubacteria bacterium]
MPIKPFIPRKLPLKISYENVIKEIINAHRAIAGLNASLSHLPNPKILGRTMQTKEAVLSSRIEGTQASLNEVFEYEAKMEKSRDTEKKVDIQEITSYRDALNHGVQHLKNKPINEDLIKKLHEILLRTGRGRDKTPGQFRKTQVYIGRPGASINEASFVPPPANYIIPLIANLEKYLNRDLEKDALVQIAIAHYQFEAIHPFLDGNGRVGRLLISLFLYKKELLVHPFLYLSEFFEKNREDYYALLSGVSETGDIKSWVKFFLYAVTVQAKKAKQASDDILVLHKKLKEKMTKMSSVYAYNLLDAIFMHPVFSSASIRKDSKIKNTQTLFNLIDKFVKAEIIYIVKPNKKRNKIYIFKDLVKIINKK